MGILNDVTAYTATILRAGRGIYPAVTAATRPDPEQLLELYDFEACPYCRRVREVLCELDLDYIEHPVAKGSARRAQLKKIGGKVQAPFLIDPNSGRQMYESDDIITYLNETYGAGQRAGWPLPVPRTLDLLSAAIASAARFSRGSSSRVAARKQTLTSITLYNMEGSPYCRKVREALCELDLESVVRNLPKGSPKRAQLQDIGGKVQVPYIVDPNSGRSLYESDDIVAYLEAQYG